jgi:two-component system CheB/CheR fusion protein
MKMPSRILLGIVSSVVVSGVVAVTAFGILRDMQAEIRREQTLSEISDRTRVLHILVASLNERSAGSDVHQVKGMLESLDSVLKNMSSRSPSETVLIRRLRQAYRELGPLIDQWFSSPPTPGAILASQLWMKVQFLSDDTRRLTGISRSRILTAQQWTQATLLALIILLAVSNGVIYVLSVRSVVRAQASLSDVLDDTRRLYDLTKDMARQAEPQVLFERLMDAAVEIMASDFASLQILYPGRGEPGGKGELRLVAHRGFPPEAARHWEWVRADSSCACGIALRTGMRCDVPDLVNDERIAGRDLDVCLLTGMRAVQTTPLLARDGRRLGAISTHWKARRHPEFLNGRHWRMFDVLVRHAADLLERLSSEQALVEGEQRFRLLVNVITDVPWVTDPRGAFIEPQPEWEAYTGQTWEQQQGFGWVEALHPDDRERVKSIWLESCASRTICEHQGRLWHASNREYRHYVARAAPLLDTDGSVREWVGTCTDVHEQKQAEEALRQADRRKNEFLATLAHELRNPLAPVRNAVQLLRMKEPADRESRWARDVIGRQVQQMTRLIDDLMDVSRISQGRIALKRERVALAHVIEGAVESNRPLIEQCGHQLSVELPAQPVSVDADPVRLTQLFSNLLNNAAKYSDRGGSISLTAGRQDGDVVVSVKDSGIGIPHDKLPGIFDLFSQVQGALDRSQGGLGIGLSLVKRLVEMHGGTIEARSEGPGKGSEFVVRLPIVVEQQSGTTRDAGNDVEAPAPPSRVLIVDDNRDAADSLEMMLRQMGHETRTAYDGEEAVRAAGEFRPEVVLLDIGLPKLNGYDACRLIRQQSWGRSMVVIAVTGWGQDQDRRKAQDAGFDRHVVKPVDPGHLVHLLGSLPAEQAG